MKNRTLLMIPGPIEFEPAVLAALGAADDQPCRARTSSRSSARRWSGCARYSSARTASRSIVAGSGTLAMDLAGGQPGGAGRQRRWWSTPATSATALRRILARYGADVTHVRAPVGGVPVAG